MPDYNLGTAHGEIVIGSDTRGVDQAEQAVGRFSQTTQRDAANAVGALGTAGIVAGAAVAGGMVVAVKSAMDFEQRMSAVGAVSGASGKEMDKLSVLALRLGKDTSFSATESASAIEELVKAGISVPDVMNGAADATVALAAAGEVSLPEAAELAANAMNAFGLSAKEMPRVADLIAGAANASAISVGEFRTSLQQVGAVANLAGISFDDTATAIALLGNAGIKGSDAGTSLKTMFQRLTPQTDKAKDAFKDLGIITEDGANRFYDAQGNMKSLADVSGILQQSLKGMTAEQKQATLNTLFGSDAIRAAAILSDEGSAGFDKMAKSMGKVTAAEVAGKRMDNLAGSLEQLKGSAETVAIQFGQVLLPMVRKVVDGATALLNKILELDADTVKLILTVVAGVGAFAGFMGVALKLGSAIGTVTTVLRNAGGAVRFLQAMLAANPIGFAITAIGLLAAGLALLYNRSATARSIMQAVWRVVKTGLVVAFNLAKAAVTGFIAVIKAVGGFIAAHSTTFKIIAGVITAFFIPAMIRAGVQATIMAAKTVAAWVASSAGAVASGAIQAASAARAVVAWGILGVQSLLNAAKVAAAWLIAMGPIGLIIAAVIAVVALIIANWDTVKAFLIKVWNKIKDVAQSVWNGIKDFFSTVFNAIKRVVTTVFNAVRAYVTLVFNSYKKIITTVINVIHKVIVRTLQIIQKAWMAIWNAIKTVTTTVINVIKAVIQRTIQIIKTIISSTMSAIRGAWSSAWNGIKSVASAVWNVIKAVVLGAIRGVQTFIAGTMQNIRSAWSSAWNAVKSTVSDIWNGIKSAVKSAIDSVLGFVRGLKSSITGVFSGASSWLTSAGRNIIQGLIDGIMNMAGRVTDAVGGIVGRARDMLPFSPAKAGPLKTHPPDEAGEQIMRMLASGIDKRSPLISDAMTRAAGLVNAPDYTPTIGAAAGRGGPAPVYLDRNTAPAGMNIQNLSVTIPAADIEQMRNVTDFFDRLEHVARAKTAGLRTGAA